MTEKERARRRLRAALFKCLIEAWMLAYEDRGTTKQDIADRLGCNLSTITRLLAGPSDMTIGQFADLIWALDAEVDFL